MKIFVLGHRGMLGSAVKFVFEKEGYEVVTSETRYSNDDRQLIQEVRDSDCEWVINAIGKIKQKTSNFKELYIINSSFPQHLVFSLKPHQRLIHASTDCVFSGKKGNYSVFDFTDATDDYGFTKKLGEAVARKSLVFRVSIIGIDKEGVGLLSWFLSQRGTVKGFINHLWNGITTVEWAKAALEVVKNPSLFKFGIIQLGSQTVTKYSLLSLIKEIWKLDTEIEPIGGEKVDRTLKIQWQRAGLRNQLEELNSLEQTFSL